MKNILRALAVVAALWASPALAQSSPGWTFGFVPTPAQWNAAFGNKQDYLGAAPLLTTGGVMSGPLITSPSSASLAGFNLPPGIAPTSPNNGDAWTTASGIFIQINGATVGPLTSAATPCTNCALTTNPLSQFASTTSAQLRGVLSDESGTGLALFQNGALGAATATSINGITISASTGTLTLNSNTLVIAGTGTILTLNPTTSGSTTTITTPSTSSTMARTDTGQTFAGTNVFSGAVGFQSTVAIQSASAFAFAVGLNGSTNPAFLVDASTALQVSGLGVAGDVTGGTVKLTAIDSGSNTNIRLNAKGTGVINIGNVSSGTVNIGGGGGGLTVTSSFTATGLVGLANLAAGTQDTVIGFFTSTAASATSIPNCTGALTYSTAAHTIGCNATAGTGTVTTTGSPAANQVAFFSGSTAITGAAVGSVGQHLGITGTSTPTFKSGGWELLNTTSGSAVANIQDTTSFGLGYSEYEIVIEGLACATTASTAEIQVLVGGTPTTTGYSGTWLQGNGTATSSTQITTGIPMTVTGTCPATSTPGSFVKVFTYSPSVSAIHAFVGESASSQGAGVQSGVISGQTPSAAVLSGYQLLSTSGNITVTAMKTYGRL